MKPNGCRQGDARPTAIWRTDQLAYRGVKASGIDREGLRYVVRDMTEERLVAFNL